MLPHLVTACYKWPKISCINWLKWLCGPWMDHCNLLLIHRNLGGTWQPNSCWTLFQTAPLNVSSITSFEFSFFSSCWTLSLKLPVRWGNGWRRHFWLVKGIICKSLDILPPSSPSQCRAFLHSKHGRLRMCHLSHCWLEHAPLVFFFFLESNGSFLSEMLIVVNVRASVTWLIMHVWSWWVGRSWKTSVCQAICSSARSNCSC